MDAQSLCAQVARQLGEPLRFVERFGFQHSRVSRPVDRTRLKAVDCPFCGRHTIVAPPNQGEFDVECRSCDTLFAASLDEVYLIALSAAQVPTSRPRAFAEC